MTFPYSVAPTREFTLAVSQLKSHFWYIRDEDAIESGKQHGAVHIPGSAIAHYVRRTVDPETALALQITPTFARFESPLPDMWRVPTEQELAKLVASAFESHVMLHSLDVRWPTEVSDRL